MKFVTTFELGSWQYQVIDNTKYSWYEIKIVDTNGKAVMMELPSSHFETLGDAYYAILLDAETRLK